MATFLVGKCEAENFTVRIASVGDFRILQSAATMQCKIGRLRTGCLLQWSEAGRCKLGFAKRFFEGTLLANQSRLCTSVATQLTYSEDGWWESSGALCLIDVESVVAVIPYVTDNGKLMPSYCLA